MSANMFFIHTFHQLFISYFWRTIWVCLVHNVCVCERVCVRTKWQFWKYRPKQNVSKCDQFLVHHQYYLLYFCNMYFMYKSHVKLFSQIFKCEWAEKKKKQQQKKLVSMFGEWFQFHLEFWRLFFLLFFFFWGSLIHGSSLICDMRKLWRKKKHDFITKEKKFFFYVNNIIPEHTKGNHH